MATVAAGSRTPRRPNPSASEAQLDHIAFLKPLGLGDDLLALTGLRSAFVEHHQRCGFGAVATTSSGGMSPRERVAPGGHETTQRLSYGRLMTLTLGTGPLSATTDGVLQPSGPSTSAAFAQPYPRRVRAVVGGRVVLDSEGGVMLHRSDGLPTLWVPLDDVDHEALPDPEALRSAPPDGPLAAVLRDMVQLKFAAAERWLVEDDPVYAHFKDPYHRVDVVSSSRHVVVRQGDQLIADTHRPRLLFETGLPVRYYLPWADVSLDVLTRSSTVSECPYKGDGQHWHLETEGGRVEDAAWSLPHPLPEGVAAIEHLSFYPEKVEVTVDGRRLIV